MIDGSEKRNRKLAFELQNSHVREKRNNNAYFLYFVIFYKEIVIKISLNTCRLEGRPSHSNIVEALSC